jgi:hypothetical protein
MNRRHVTEMVRRYAPRPGPGAERGEAHIRRLARVGIDDEPFFNGEGDRAIRRNGEAYLDLYAIFTPESLDTVTARSMLYSALWSSSPGQTREGQLSTLCVGLA